MKSRLFLGCVPAATLMRPVMKSVTSGSRSNSMPCMPLNWAEPKPTGLKMSMSLFLPFTLMEPSARIFMEPLPAKCVIYSLLFRLMRLLGLLG